MKYTLTKFEDVLLDKVFVFFISLINDSVLTFHEYYLCVMFPAPCINTITEPLSYSRFSFFPWNVIGFSIFMALSK